MQPQEPVIPDPDVPGQSPLREVIDDPAVPTRPVDDVYDPPVEGPDVTD